LKPAPKNISTRLALKPYVAFAKNFRSGETTPRAYLESCLDMIARIDPTVGAFLHLNIDAAQRTADEAGARWRSGKELSPIDGMPIGIKDIIETIDMPTGQGSPLWKGHMSRRDSASVHALREAGAIILGKTSTTEFAATEPWPSTFNPHDRSRTPGGSSSGSAAAVGAGMIPAADTFDRQARIYDLFQAGREAEAESIYREVLPAIVFVMQSLETLHCYGKRLAARRLGLGAVHDRVPALAADAFGLQCVERYAAALGPLA